MSPLPEMIIAVMVPFAGLFSAAVWSHAQVLVIGAVLCQGPRMVAAALRVMGLGQEPRFERYHRVLSRARWSGLQAAQILVGLVIQWLSARGVPLLVVDDTLEWTGQVVKVVSRWLRRPWVLLGDGTFAGVRLA